MSAVIHKEHKITVFSHLFWKGEMEKIIWLIFYLFSDWLISDTLKIAICWHQIILNEY